MQEIEHLTREIESARVLLTQEQQERVETEQVLQALMDEAQALRATRDQDRNELSQQEAMTEIKHKGMQDTIAGMENRLIEATQTVTAANNARLDAEQAYATLERLRVNEQNDITAQRTAAVQKDQEINALRASHLDNENSKLIVSGLEHDKLDLTQLLQESQDYLIQAKEEFQAKLSAEEHRWNDRLQVCSSELHQMEIETKTHVRTIEVEKSRVQTMMESAREQRGQHIRLEEENKRLLLGNQTNAVVIESLQKNQLRLQDAGRETLQLARDESRKNGALLKELEHVKESRGTKIEQLNQCRVELKVAAVTNAKLRQKWNACNVQLQKSDVDVHDLEQDVGDIAKANEDLMNELDGLRNSYSDFLGKCRHSNLQERVHVPRANVHK